MMESGYEFNELCIIVRNQQIAISVALNCFDRLAEFFSSNSIRPAEFKQYAEMMKKASDDIEKILKKNPEPRSTINRRNDKRKLILQKQEGK